MSERPETRGPSLRTKRGRQGEAVARSADTQLSREQEVVGSHFRSCVDDDDVRFEHPAVGIRLNSSYEISVT